MGRGRPVRVPFLDMVAHLAAPSRNLRTVGALSRVPARVERETLPRTGRYNRKRTVHEPPGREKSGPETEGSRRMNWKIATFNVNGLRTRLPVVLEWLKEHQPDLLCMQEIKCRNEDFPLEPFEALGYRATVRGQKSFNGVALLSRDAPEDVLPGFDDGEPDEEARMVAGRFRGVWVLNTYVPQGRDPEHPAFQQKLDFFRRVGRWVDARFSPRDALVWVGDLNVAPEEIDVFAPQRMEGKIGFHPAERAAFARVAEWGLVDLFRRRHPEEKAFSFWDYRIPGAFSKDLGWRLDFIMVTRPMEEACTECLIDGAPRGRPNPSDHAPVWAAFNLDKLARE